MRAPIVAFFNNKGGVGKTSLVYHLAWMYAELGIRVVAADLDPQANLTAASVDEDVLEILWPADGHPKTVYGCVRPLMRGVGDIGDPYLEDIEPAIALLVGDLALSSFEDQLSDAWPRCLDREERAFRVMSAFWRIQQRAAEQHQADIVLMDMGPNLGAINRSALIAADYVVFPLSPDLFSLQGLRNLGPALRGWRSQWADRLPRNPDPDLPLPPGRMAPAGYVVLQHSVRLDRPVKAYDKWIARIPEVYRTSVLGEPGDDRTTRLQEDPHCIAMLKHYRSLMPLALEARKPMFHLKPADGALGAHMQAAQSAYRDFEELARRVAHATGVMVPQPQRAGAPLVLVPQAG
ncbi:MAG: AAA family ATPase [Armatimonadetes bacterium]|nr:AAA family ATPase [Armatimonadota bacterium]